jgi:hypothetical protein
VGRLHGEQAEILDHIDFIGNNGWARTPQTDAMMPKLLGDLAELGVPIARVREALRSIGYGPRRCANWIAGSRSGLRASSDARGPRANLHRSDSHASGPEHVKKSPRKARPQGLARRNAREMSRYG